MRISSSARLDPESEHLLQSPPQPLAIDLNSNSAQLALSHRLKLTTARYAYVAASTFCFVLYAFSLARLHAVWFDPRFALIALGLCGSGLALGAAVAQTRFAGRLDLVALGISGPFAALPILALLFLEFGPPLRYVLTAVLIVLPFASWMLGLSRLASSAADPIRNNFAGAAAWVAAGAAVVCLWTFNLPSGPLLAAVLAAAGIALTAMLVVPRAGAAAATLAFGILALVSAATDWQFSPAIKWAPSEGGSLAKVRYFPDTAAARGPVRSSAVWGPFSLIELARDGASGDETLSIYANGTFDGLIPSARSDGGDAATLARAFPVVALPLLAAHPQRILIANPHGALELRLALDRRVPEVHILERRDNLHGLRKAREHFRELLSQSRVAEHPVNTPEWRPTGLDQLYLTIPQRHVAGWTDTDTSENFLFTLEAFRQHWGRLRPGGMLVVLAADQTLYIRALLQAWEALPKEYRDRRPLAAQAWGYRVLASGAPLGAYEYVALLVKGPVDRQTVDRVIGQAKDMPLVPLFGPGIAPGAVYAALAHPGGTAVALPAIGQYLVRQQNLLVDIFPATDDRPFFFQPIRDLHPYLKWLVGIGLIVLAYALLVPLAPRRRLEHPDNALGPPIPVYLAFFALASAGFAGTLTALIWAGVRYATPESLLVAVALGVAIGAAAGVWLYRQRRADTERQSWRSAAAIFATLGALTAAYILVVAPVWTRSTPEIHVLLTGLLAGVSAAFAAPGMRGALAHVSRAIPGSSPWAWVVSASGLLLGPIGALWIAQINGWTRAWAVIVFVLFASAAMALLSGRPPRKG